MVKSQTVRLPEPAPGYTQGPIQDGLDLSEAFAATAFLYGGAGAYLDDMHRLFRQGDGDLPPSWVSFFSELEPSAPRPVAPGGADSMADDKAREPLTPGAPKGPTHDTVSSPTLDAIRAVMLIRAFRARGHLVAKLDPLDLPSPHQAALQEVAETLHPKYFGFGENASSPDWQRPIYIDNVLGLQAATMDQIYSKLRRIYAHTIGVEFIHIQDAAQKSWIQKTIEAGRHVSTADKKAIGHHLMRGEGFEHFLNAKYPGAKRFGLEGSESFIVAMESVLEEAVQGGVVDVVIGMAHRGRLNVMANVLGKPLESILATFEGAPSKPDQVQGDGDVKYHIGASADRSIQGKTVHLSLTPNPSHLEAVDPVVLGKVRAKQDRCHDAKRQRVMGLLVHGDAAFAGQGLVAECLGLSSLEGYTTGGTVHIIINNQIGFTTSPHKSRSSSYASDVAKMIQAPIFHVNGDDPEAVWYVGMVASKFRQLFAQDVVIDIHGYRRHGHNEGDEPTFTQPLMYQAIKQHPSTYAQYKADLIKDGVVSAEEIAAEEDGYKDKLRRAFEEAQRYVPDKADWLEGNWQGVHQGLEAIQSPPATGVSHGHLKEVMAALVTLPKDFKAHPKIERFLGTREAMVEGQPPGSGLVDWSTAEALAFGTLVQEGYLVRLSGQDSGRGTFSQRHAVVYDQKTGQPYVPLQHVPTTRGTFEVVDSPLSEASVLGFEYGFALADPGALVLWEAQFGDFANGAQVIIDQFIAAGRSKWLRMNGIVMLLPHGYEGQGPEHSSARIERYLQLCAEKNLQVVNCTTPANYFHVLRRQMHQPFRLPLIIFTPKSLLRHKDCLSPVADFEGQSHFVPVIGPHGGDQTPQEGAHPTTAEFDAIKRVILCSGKVYYDLINDAAYDSGQTAIIRLEQLYPYPTRDMVMQLKRFPHDALVLWCQEEPQNMGAWTFVAPWLNSVLQEIGQVTPGTGGVGDTKRPSSAARVHYVGRRQAASPATGFPKKHADEQQRLIKAALTFDVTTEEWRDSAPDSVLLGGSVHVVI